jgi:uncharacterized protein YciI
MTDRPDSQETLFVLITKNKVPKEKVLEFREAHIAFLIAQRAAGVYLASGPKVPYDGGVAIARAENREALVKVIGQDPAYINGVYDYEIIEFIPRYFDI